MLMDYSIVLHKVCFSSFCCTKQYLNFRQFLIRIISMREVGKFPKHSGSKSLLQHCIDPIDFKKSETATLSQVPLPQNALCQDWLKLAQWSRRRRFLKVVITPHRNMLILLYGGTFFSIRTSFDYIKN